MQNFKENAKKAASKLKNACMPAIKFVNKLLNDGGKTCIYRSLILLLLFSLYLTLFQFFLQGTHPLHLRGPIFLNFSIILLAVCLLYFVIGKISWTFTVSVVIMSLLHAINHYKIKFRDEPLNPTDFVLGEEAGNIAQGYNLTPDLKIYCIITICLLTIILSFLFIKNKRPNLKISLAGTAAILILAVVMYTGVYGNTKIYKHFYSNKGIFQETEIVEAQGLVYSLVHNISSIQYEKPNEYSREKAERILNRYKQPEYEVRPPNVIAVMCEAYTDIQKWDNVSFSGENPYEFYNYLKSEGCYGELFVPQFGGGTATTEFEFLTGNNTSAISSSMPVAYKTIINKDTYSLAKLFKDMNFETSAIHPGDPWFYNRQNVYTHMGFDKFTSKDDLPPDTPHVVGYIRDSVSAEMIISDYNRHLEENPEQGYFNFLVTIQNHGPYDGNVLVQDKGEFISKDSGLTDEQYYIINNYLAGIKDSDDFMKTIYEYINTLDEPTVFILFGDHLPFLDSDEQIFSILGLDIASGTYEAYENRYSTDYVIIGNDAYLKNNTPSINGKQNIISSNYLSVKLMKYMNMELPPFQAFLNDMMQYAPIISRQHNGTSTGFGETPPEEFDTLFSEYKILQYYNLYDYPTD